VSHLLSEILQVASELLLRHVVLASTFAVPLCCICVCASVCACVCSCAYVRTYK